MRGRVERAAEAQTWRVENSLSVPSLTYRFPIFFVCAAPYVSMALTVPIPFPSIEASVADTPQLPIVVAGVVHYSWAWNELKQIVSLSFAPVSASSLPYVPVGLWLFVLSLRSEDVDYRA